MPQSVCKSSERGITASRRTRDVAALCTKQRRVFYVYLYVAGATGAEYIIVSILIVVGAVTGFLLTSRSRENRL